MAKYSATSPYGATGFDNEDHLSYFKIRSFPNSQMIFYTLWNHSTITDRTCWRMTYTMTQNYGGYLHKEIWTC